MRCPASSKPCDYPERVLSGPIAHDDPDLLVVTCNISGGAVHTTFGRAHIAGPDGMIGFQLGLTLGFDAATGFDLERQCQVWMIEEDGRQWSSTCRDLGPCRVEAPSLIPDGELSLGIRCEDMSSIPFQGGREALLAAAADPDAAITIQISRCTQH